MWSSTFDARLQAWHRLRQDCQGLTTADALLAINQWWFQSPWQPYHLHWDDLEDWPDPWELLADNYFCDVARGLGILYTITLLDRGDLAPAKLVLTDDDLNLVLIDQTKYILNWNTDEIVNTSLILKHKRQYTQEQVRQKYL